MRRNALTIAGVLIALGGGVAALVLYPGAQRFCTPPSGAAGSQRSSAFANGCVGHGVPFVVAIGVLALGAFVIVNSVALSARAAARRRPAPPFDTTVRGRWSAEETADVDLDGRTTVVRSDEDGALAYGADASAEPSSESSRRFISRPPP